MATYNKTHMFDVDIAGLNLALAVNINLFEEGMMEAVLWDHFCHLSHKQTQMDNFERAV